MPVSAALGAAALGGAGLQGLWQYNRDNYFFDVPLKQNRRFQLQNIGMARFALFREDLRDLSALTTDKVQNYFVVNTLKLGFIVTIFFNFDRTDTEADKMNYVEEQINLLFSVTLMTGFFFLLTSIWFSMHAVMLAESITTKMLVQACRIPMPTMGEVQRSATDAKYFETDFSEAFRVPFLAEKSRSKLQRLWRGANGFGGGQKPVDGSEAHGLGSETEGGWRFWRTGSPGAQRSPGSSQSQVRGQEVPQGDGHNSDNEDALRCGAQMGRGKKGPGLIGLSILDVLDGCIDPEALSEIDTSLEPHLKFYRLVRPTWTGYDLYGKIAMEVGTANLLSGLGYYAIFYCRDQGNKFSVNPGGWVAFTFLSVLAWYSLILDLQISFLKHVVLAAIKLFAFLGTVFYINFSDSKVHWWLLTAVVMLQALWVQLVCWSGAGFGSHYPTAWRATRFLNVLHMEEEPAPFQPDHLNVQREKAMISRNGSNRSNQISPRFDSADISSVASNSIMSLASPDGSRRGQARPWTASPRRFLNSHSPVPEEDLSSGDEEDSEADSEKMEMDVLQAFAGAFPLLHCLGVLLSTLPLGRHKKTVHLARDRLYEAARAAGALPVGPGSTETVGLIKPFWILLPPSSKRSSPEAYRLDMSGGIPEMQQELSNEQCNSEVTLQELLAGARKVADVLFADSKTWTVRDMQRLARYGGEPIPGVASFLGQFHEKGSTNTRFLGSTAKTLFRMGVLITAVLWAACCFWSVNLSVAELRNAPVDTSGYKKVTGKRTSDVLEAFGRREAMKLPRPWLVPSSMGCDSDGHRLVLGDGDGAFIGRPNGTTWRGPSRPCWGAELLSADFGPHGQLWLSTTLGVHVEQQMQQSGGRLCTPRPIDAPKLDKMALDSVPPPGGTMPGLALSGGRLHALEADTMEGWRLAGTIGTPVKKKIIALAIRAGHAFVLDSIGTVHRLNSLTGKWDDPVVLSKDYQWKGICALAEGGDWLALGRPMNEVGARELWHFSPPAHKKKTVLP